MPERREVVLTDETGAAIGTMDKELAHLPPGHLHLAFSVFLFDRRGQTLLQQRAESKYHFAGVWANACCSHPEPGALLVDSARRRLGEELGLDCELSEVGSFTYRAVDVRSGLVEHELDHVLLGRLPDGAAPRLAPEEVQAWRFAPVEEVAGLGPADGFAPWFAEALALAVG